MYLQTRQTNLVYVWTPNFRTAYRILRERNNFGVLAAIRYGWWLAYGNKAMYPGEFGAWANAQIDQHPYAIGITLGVSGYLLIMWVVWMIVPHGYFGRW